MPSSVIRHHSYDINARELTIIFTSGRRYIYMNVPGDLYMAFRNAVSLGSFFNQHIRDHYRYREVPSASQAAVITR